MLDFIYGMTHFFLEEEQIRSSEDLFQRQNRLELWINAMHNYMEDTWQEIEQPTKFSSQVFIG